MIKGLRQVDTWTNEQLGKHISGRVGIMLALVKEYIIKFLSLRV
jgi:hypothetical protein